MENLVYADVAEAHRTRSLRAIKRALELLNVGQSAIDRPEPKVHVMLDHADRAISFLREERDLLTKPIELCP